MAAKIYFHGKKFFIFVTFTAALLTFVLGASLLHNYSKGLNYGFFHDGIFQEKLSLPASSQHRQHVLLVTYGRSGSTFTSALINHHHKVFFIFEPLFMFRKASESYQKQNDSVGIVNSYLTCDFPVKYVYTLANPLLTDKEATRNIYKCITKQTNGVSHVACYLEFLNACRNHETVLIKTIRFRMKWAEKLLKNDPTFKLLYLVRDPRATLASQARAFRDFDWNSEIVNVSRLHCSLVDDDLKEAERLAQLFPGRVKGLRYENGATDPFSYTKDIYTFLALDYNEEVASYVRNITSSSVKNKLVNRKFSVVRVNSTRTMDTWRQWVTFTDVHAIDKVCGYLYPKLGYKFVTSQADLESSRSLVVTPTAKILKS